MDLVLGHGDHQETLSVVTHLYRLRVMFEARMVSKRTLGKPASNSRPSPLTSTDINVDPFR